ncbi:hypothetical protein HZU40_20065 [Mycolicibacterium fluoranthenivorans]|jgi:FtsZ-interacting cell division protein ZipA|uniref:Uncharacterized protein n=1 Tax=Mycolicibacterium fluoranthenivorans TaxID=258505 RepID=A0A1G4WBR6_9MYCO|nr:MULTISPECIES: hypothetical protein [Mycobacteriaceae]MCV7256284.1 hypothetical protein [Mycobacterium hackensackense]QNJ90554.1 hypothetical protein HZU40_20065 [Mycolicibacterium fluoranthenivorans]SCX19371.1 hypothetical protein SAMN02799620_02675 [Mycolicibacterium fluoranthenivorans]
MATPSILLIVLVVCVAILLIVAIAWVARDRRNAHRHIAAEEIRESAKDEARDVRQREAWADETAARARAAQAESDVKAAQAAGLQQQAEAHRSEAVDSREKLNQQWERADSVDPAVHTPEKSSGVRKEHQDR